MSNAGQIIADWGREHIGCGYIYGAKGQECSLKFRQQQAAQYPQYADQILGKNGAQWDGKSCYDCAQYTKAAAKAAGGVLPSGATSQWNDPKAWDGKGTIDAMPDEPGIILYKWSGKDMSHTGIYIGNGETAEAQGHGTGCVLRKLTQGTWTHWARHVVAARTAVDKPVESSARLATVITESDNLNMRSGPGTGYGRVGSVPRNAMVEVLSDANPDWWQVRYAGQIAWAASAYLRAVVASDGQVDTPTPEPDEQPPPALYEVVVSELNALQAYNIAHEYRAAGHKAEVRLTEVAG